MNQPNPNEYTSTESAAPAAESQSRPTQGTEILSTAEARLAELAPEIRRVNEETKGSLLVAMQNVLPHVRIAGDLLIEAQDLCKKDGILWEPWVRDNCQMSERTAQAYTRIARHWGEIIQAQSSAPLSIDGALKWLARPKEKTKAAKDDDDCRSGTGGGDRGAGGGGAGEQATGTGQSPIVTIEWEGDDAGVTLSEKPVSPPGDPQDITRERLRELEDALKDSERTRDHFIRETFSIIAGLVAGLVDDVQVGEWDKRDRRELSKLADQMATSVASIKSTLGSPQPSQKKAQALNCNGMQE